MKLAGVNLDHGVEEHFFAGFTWFEVGGVKIGTGEDDAATWGRDWAGLMAVIIVVVFTTPGFTWTGIRWGNVSKPFLFIPLKQAQITDKGKLNPQGINHLDRQV